MRLIDADKLMENKFKNDISYNAFCNLVKRQPSIDAVPQWISMTERLPEPDERVLVYTAGKEIHVWDAMPHRAESYAWEDEEGLYHSLYEVDLWMPLPKPYEAERKES